MFLQDFEFMILKKHVMLLYFVVYKKNDMTFLNYFTTAMSIPGTTFRVVYVIQFKYVSLLNLNMIQY